MKSLTSNLTPGTIAALAGTVASAIIGFLTAFGIFPFTQTQAGAVIDLCVFGFGTGALVYAWLHTWSTDTYDVGQVTAAATSAINLVLAALSAFGAFHATTAQQSSLTAVAGALGLLGAYVFAALHTRKVVQARRALHKLHNPGR